LISSTTVTKAIASYERTAVSFDSPYDRWVKGDDKALTADQQKGLAVFFGRGNCAASYTYDGRGYIKASHHRGICGAPVRVAGKLHNEGDMDYFVEQGCAMPPPCMVIKLFPVI
jgi:cytochrome c peroxidase